MKNIYTIYFTIVIGLFFSQCKKNNNNNNNTQQNGCLVYNSIDTSGNVDIYVYDNQGRIIVDSSPGNPPTYYNYSGNTVASTDGGYAGVSATLNSSGWPISNVVPSPFGNPETFAAIYNADGTLDSITDGSPGSEAFVDSIVYVNGNIVSFTDPINGIRTTCTYNNIPYKPCFPQTKIFALSSQFGGGLEPGYPDFNPQPFCKNLLTSYSFPVDTGNRVYAYTVTCTLSYQTDSKGDIIYIYNTTTSFNNSTSAYSVHFSYNCP